jgi:hypothetical protein
VTAAFAAAAVVPASATAPTQTIFASGTQRVSGLYLLITLHQRGKLSVSASAGRYHYSGFHRSVPPHIPSQVRLKLSSSQARAARRALKRGRHMTATVRSTGRNQSGESRTFIKRIKLKP